MLVLLAGCLGSVGDGGLDEDRLDEAAEYRWNATVDAHVRVETDAYYAVYDLEGDTTVELSREAFGGEEPIDVWAIHYRHPNGTVVTGDDLRVEQGSSATVIEVPGGNGTLAFAGPGSSKEVYVPPVVTGSYRLVLPPGHRVGNFFLSDVRPGGYETQLEGDRQTLRWSEIDRAVFVRHYLWRDHYLFYGAMGLAGAVAIGGALVFRRRIRRLRRRRRELGLDLEGDDRE